MYRIQTAMIALFVLVLPACDAERALESNPSEADRVQEFFARFEAALATGDAERAAVLVERSVFDAFQSVHRLSHQADAVEVWALPLDRRALLLEMRHFSGGDELDERMGSSLFGELVERRASTSVITTVELTGVEVTGDRARATGRLGGQSLATPVDFVHDGERWRVSAASFMALIADATAVDAAVHGVDPNDAILARLEEVSGEPVDPRIWDVPGAAPETQVIGSAILAAEQAVAHIESRIEAVFAQPAPAPASIDASRIFGEHIDRDRGILAVMERPATSSFDSDFEVGLTEEPILGVGSTYSLGSGGGTGGGGAGFGRAPGIGGIDTGGSHGEGSSEPRRTAALVYGTPTISGSLGFDEVWRVVRRHRNSVRYCYESELHDEPALEGGMVVEMTIDADGSVSDCSAGEGTLGDASLEACVVRCFVRMQFPALPAGGVTHVRYPLTFQFE